MSKKTKVWLDCDPGIDDAFAIVLAAFSDAIDLIGISTVSGNQSIDKITYNALKMVNICGLIQKPTVDLEKNGQNEAIDLKDCLSHGGLKFPILKGSSKPLFRKLMISDVAYGESGLDTHKPVEWPEIPKYALEYTNRLAAQTSPHFTTRMYDYFRSFAPEKVTIIAIAPLTNIALLLINHPDVVKYIDKIVLMGGSIGNGNFGPSEFNIIVDPEAASYVFQSGINIYMIPLEVTHTALATKSVIDKIETPQTKFSEIMTSMVLFCKNSCPEHEAGPPIHDPCAVAFLTDPSIFEYRLMHVSVETMSPLTSGMTVCDVNNYYVFSDRPKNVHVCLKMNVEKFWGFMLDALSKANESSLKIKREE